MVKLTITTHSGSEYSAEVAEYNAIETNEKLNDSTINTVVFGDTILSRIDVKSVVKVAEEAVE